MEQKLSSKIILSATLKSESPFLIGKGSGNDADVDVMLREDGKPYIPASSLAGCIRKNIETLFVIGNKENSDYFWGSKNTGNTKTSQSHIIFQDLIPTTKKPKIMVRDGIRINNETGIVETGAKYDYQCVEAGVEFQLKAEITIRESFDETFFLQMVKSIQYILKNNFHVGAHTTTGFGKLKCSDFKAYHFKFPDNALQWFQYLKDESQLSSFPQAILVAKFPMDTSQKTFQIQLSFSLKSSLIVGAAGVDPNDSDKKQLYSNQKPVLPGKSIKGAIRHRALKILKALENEEAEEFLKNMMGWVDTKGNQSEAKKSRLYIEETVLEGGETHIHNRNKIDRFTGGTIDGALFSSEPVVKKGDESFLLTFKLKNYKEAEAGLLLLLLKDFWNEDLPIGGEKSIGRGVLTGQKATINSNGQIIELERQPDNKLQGNPQDREILESYVQALVNLKRKI